MAASLPLEGVETNMLLLLDSGRSRSDIGTKGVQLYILYTVYYVEDTVYIVHYTGYISRYIH
jgi:hypothetical protein